MQCPDPERLHDHVLGTEMGSCHTCAMTQPRPASIEEAQLKRLRQQMREQDERRYRDPDAEVGRREFRVLVWRRKQWKQMGIIWRARLTPKVLNAVRKRFAKLIQDDEVMRIVSANASAYGGPPQAPPTSKRMTRLQRHNARLAAKRDKRRQLREVATRRPKRRRVTDSRLSKCEVGYRVATGRGKRCPYRAPWMVAYTDATRHRRVVRRCCARHAWDDRVLPPQARHIVRIERKFA